MSTTPFLHRTATCWGAGVLLTISDAIQSHGRKWTTLIKGALARAGLMYWCACMVCARCACARVCVCACVCVCDCSPQAWPAPHLACLGLCRCLCLPLLLKVLHAGGPTGGLSTVRLVPCTHTEGLPGAQLMKQRLGGGGGGRAQAVICLAPPHHTHKHTHRHTGTHHHDHDMLRFLSP